MGRSGGAVCLLLLLVCLSVRGAHEPPSGVPAFVRSAVESVPEPDKHQFAKFSMAPTFGEVFLPLRSAVESAPSGGLSPLKSTKSFIRSAVEFVPTDEAHDMAVGETHPFAEFAKPPGRTATGERYSAFVLPNSYNRDDPEPFRSGSPFQELVDAESVQQTTTLDNNYAVPPARLRLRFNSFKAESQKPKVLCYMTNWAMYRKNEGQFAPENLDTNLCSAVIYSFASLDADTLMIREFDPWIDLENDLYRRTTSMNVPVLLALGGWTDSSGDKYSRLVSSSPARQAFASNLYTFLARHGFSGLHLDWNYPKCWQSDCQKGPSSDKPNFTKLIQDIRSEFDKRQPDFQLGIAISGYKEVITEAYELDALSKAVDYLTVMSYDYHGAWEQQTGHVSPLYGRPSDKYPQYNTDYTMQLLVKNGAAKEKLILSVPFYGQSFTLTEHHNDLVGEGTPAVGPGQAGEFTRQPGMMAYYEICLRVRKNKWMVGRDSLRKSGPYAMLRNQWVGYEDPASVEAKARYALNSGFGGIAAWTIDLDDFQNRCCGEAFPLLKAINRALGLLSSPPPSGENCMRPAAPVTPVAPVMTTVGENGIPGGMHEHTTWPSWNPSSSMKPDTTTSPPSWNSTTTRRPTWTTQSSTASTMSTPWWQTTTTSAPSTWWPKPTTTSTTTTTTSTTTRRPTTTTTTTTTTRRPPPTPAMEGTTIPSPAIVMPVFIDDEKCTNGEFKADPQNCSAYYQCVYDELRQLFCPGGLHWNDRNKHCDWPDSAKCMTKQQDDSRPTAAPTTTTTTVRPSTTRTTTTRWTTAATTKTTRRTTPRPIQIVSSTSKPLGDTGCEPGMYYSHEECDSYYVCVNGKLVPGQCAGDLYWDPRINSCNWADEVSCLSRSTYLRLIDNRASAEDPCEGGTFLPYPGDCTQYLQCQWGRLEPAPCSEGLHWNPNQNICDWPSNANCKEQDEGHPPIDNGIDNNVDSQPGFVPMTTTRKPITTTTPRPTYPTDRPVLDPLSGYYKVVCYFTNWAWYRKGLGRYTPDDINTDLCTHIVYGFAVLDYSELTIRTHDSWADIENHFYTRVSSLKSKGVKVTLALGGWNDSQGDKYSRLVLNAASRAKFIKHAVQFIEKYDFDGLDLDWEYPVCWQTDCSKGSPDEKKGFTELVRELSAEFKPKGWLLSTAVSPSKKIIDAGYDVSTLSQYFDWIAVMTYDFHGQWDKKTGHVAPLYYHPDDDYDYFNANFSLNYWIEKGAPSRKIVMGMPLYGQSFSLSDAKNHGLNAHAPGPGSAGEFTKAAGFLAYYEICDRVKTKEWTVVKDIKGRMGPYAYKGNQWVSFDDRETLIKKANLVKKLNLGGGMVWALDLDDFKNRCGEGVHPLLTAIRNTLKDSESCFDAPDAPEEIEPEIEAVDPDLNIEQQLEDETVKDPNLEVEEAPIEVNPPSNEIPGSTTLTNDFKVVCYFTNWAWYRQGGGKYVPEDVDSDLCTHVVYGFAVLDRDRLTIKPHDSWADIDNKFYERVVAYKAKGIKVTVAIGGWNDSAGDKYARLVLDASARARFVQNVIEFIQKWNFDGLDLDWEYPVCWQVDCKKGDPREKEGFSTLVMELSRAFKPHGLLLSSAVSPSKMVIDAGYDVPVLAEYFDWIAVMTYDYHGQWDKKTGHVAPMYEHPDDFEPTFNANFSINYWIEKGADRKKLVMGMPMYGQSFSLADNARHHLNSPTYGGGEAGEATRARGFLSYYEICHNIRNRGWTVVRDRRGRMGPYAYSRDQWVSFDDAPMIRHKSEFVKAMELGGAMIWALDLDDFRNNCDCEKYPLLKTINRVLRNYPGPHPKCKLEDRAELAPEGTTQNEPKPTTSTTPRTTTWPSWSTTTVSPTTTKPVYVKPTYRPSSERPTVVVPTRPPSSPRPTLEPMDPVDLNCKGRNFAAHPNCNKYYICQFGVMREQSCPEGLHWNTDHCDWPQNSDCRVSAGDDFSHENPLPIPEEVTEKPTKKPVTAPPKPTTERPKPTTVKPTVIQGSDKYKVVCYFTNWAWYRPGEGKYTPDDIDDSLCTHIVYGFAVLNRDTLTIKTHDSWADIDNRFYERVTEHRRKGIKVTLAIGGWNDSLGDKYSRLVKSPEARARFVRDVIMFLQKYGFDGLDLDWEYPVCWQVDCTKGSPDEKEAFAALVRELSEEFRPLGLLLSAAVSPSKMVIDAGYDVPTLAQYFDWIAVMTYDFHGHWDKQTGHVAPLYYMPGDKYDYFNGNFSIRYWIEKGAPPEKIIMGMPLYGQSFSLVDSTKRGLNDKSYGPGEAGRYTRAGGFLAYYEICEKVNHGGWTVVRDPEGRIGPYAYHGSQWVSYDDVAEIRRKSNFVKEMNLGGGMVWALDLDDFRGRCGCGKHPLLRTLNQELRGISGQRASDCT